MIGPLAPGHESLGVLGHYVGWEAYGQRSQNVWRSYPAL